MSNVKGSVLLSRLDFVTRRHGDSGISEVLEALPEEDRQVVKSLLPAQWYPFDLCTRLDGAVMSVVGGGKSDTFRALGVQSADSNLAGVHKVYVRQGEPHGLLRKAPAIYQLYYDTGHRTYEQTGETSCRLTTHDSRGFSEADCLTVIGWHERAVELCGGNRVRVEHPRCRARKDDVCEYLISWNVVPDETGRETRPTM